MILLAGAVVQRVDIAPHAAAIHVRVPGETLTLLLAITDHKACVGILESGARRDVWSGSRWPLAANEGARRHAREALESGHVIAVFDDGIAIERGGAMYDVLIDRARVVVRRRAVDSAIDAKIDAKSESDRDALCARGVELARAIIDVGIEERRAIVRAAIARAIVKLGRRADAVRGDLARIDDADALSNRAQWLVAEAARAPRGARSLSVVDWSSGEAKTLEIPLDPALPARVQVEAMFRRARRLKKGAHIAGERLAATEHALARLADLTNGIASADTIAAFDAILDRAREAAPRDVRVASPVTATSSASQPRSLPYRTFVTTGGARILVGRGAAQNDALTFHVAKPHDLWLHVKGKPGAHVVVPLAKNSQPAAELLVDAAHLAAHFSDARGESVVDVQYAARKYLRKPRGSAPGAVAVDREKVIVLRIDDVKMRALLEREESDA